MSYNYFFCELEALDIGERLEELRDRIVRWLYENTEDDERRILLDAALVAIFRGARGRVREVAVKVIEELAPDLLREFPEVMEVIVESCEKCVYHVYCPKCGALICARGGGDLIADPSIARECPYYEEA
ncbi:MAG: hypothetical protein DRJ67_04100 [Thermoprotei archaeon]|nr:MAG: hypothetical protein DRJ67_04100 [Thermoprotei archaeon]